MSIEFELFDQAKRRARRRGFFGGIILVLVVLAVLLFANMISDLKRGDPHIARVKVAGQIHDDKELQSEIDASLLDDTATLDQSLNEEADFSVNEIVDGTIVRIEEDFVVVDVKFKSEGLCEKSNKIGIFSEFFFRVRVHDCSPDRKKKTECDNNIQKKKLNVYFRKKKDILKIRRRRNGYNYHDVSKR